MIDAPQLQRDPSLHASDWIKPEMGPWTEGYFLSNDQFDARLGRRCPAEMTLLGIGNPQALHVIAATASQTRLRRIILCDNKVEQLHHLTRLIDVVLNSDCRINFVEQLFCLKIAGPVANRLHRIQGSPLSVQAKKSQRWYELERHLWQDSDYDQQAFESRYGLATQICPPGLKIEYPNIGDLDEMHLTILSAHREHFPEWPFSAYWGQGFLASEDAFQKTKQTLQQVPLSLVVGDVAELFPQLLTYFRYEETLLWTSNVFCKYFVEKHPLLEESWQTIVRLGTQEEPHLPEIDVRVLEDNRNPSRAPRQLQPRAWRRKRSLSNHTRCFRHIASHVTGRTGVEIVNQADWIAQDGGTSKLPGFRYQTADDFLQEDLGVRHDVIFLHILLGHCFPLASWKQILERSRAKCRKLIVLEHHHKASDSDVRGKGIDPNLVREVLGPESILEVIPGQRSKRRNLCMTYEWPESVND